MCGVIKIAIGQRGWKFTVVWHQKLGWWELSSHPICSVWDHGAYDLITWLYFGHALNLSTDLLFFHLLYWLSMSRTEKSFDWLKRLHYEWNAWGHRPVLINRKLRWICSFWVLTHLLPSVKCVTWNSHA